MKRVLLVLFVVACSRSKEPTADTVPSASAAASCGSLGGSCASEGATCSPAPVGSGWSHMLMCHSGKWTEMEIAPLPQPEGKAQPPVRNLPKVDFSCNVDNDCAIVFDEIKDDAPRTYACCPGCTQRAANASWYKSFQAACATSQPPTCPPIGCVQPVAKAACRAHKCELVTK